MENKFTKFSIVISAWLLLCTLTLAQKPAADSPLRTLVLTEQGFSKMAEMQGTREAFMAFIADDGVLFRPTAVNGKQWMQAHPVPPSAKRPLLAWQPRFADVSSAGDLGYTTGPWEFKDDIKDEKPSAYGDFITVWKRQPNGLWKFVIDLGVSHPESSGPLSIWSPKDRPPMRRAAGGVNNESAALALMVRDNEFNQAVTKQGTATAFAAFVDPSFRLFRDGSAPFVGKKAAVAFLEARKESISWQPAGKGVSHSGDLGFVYGTYELKAATTQQPENGNYLRIWKKQGSTWRVALEVENHHPE